MEYGFTHEMQHIEKIPQSFLHNPENSVRLGISICTVAEVDEFSPEKVSFRLFEGVRPKIEIHDPESVLEEEELFDIYTAPTMLSDSDIYKANNLANK